MNLFTIQHKHSLFHEYDKMSNPFNSLAKKSTMKNELTKPVGILLPIETPESYPYDISSIVFYMEEVTV